MSEANHHSSTASFYASPAEALKAPPEEFLYLACLHEGTGVDAPDFLAVVDAEDGRIVHETPMPNVGDELHHFGWNRCSSACHGPDRSHLIVPGFRSSRMHIVNVADDPRAPQIEKVIEPHELVEKTGYTRPHTVHCMPGDNVVVSMLGDREGGGAGGFAVLDARTFEVKGRWENGGERPPTELDVLDLDHGLGLEGAVRTVEAEDVARALLVGFGVAWAKLRSRLCSVRSRATERTARARPGPRGAGGPV